MASDFTATGLVGSDTVSGSLTRTAGENVGSYAINLGTVSAGSNYTATYTGANLSIAPATLAVTADDKSRAVGASDPIFTASYSGFVNGDTSAVVSGLPTFSTTATTASPAGTYPITPAQGTLAATNYNFTFVNGTLTVTAASGPYNLSVTNSGLGNGTVNSNPAGIACDGTTGCSADFTSGTIVSLTATPDWKSVFAGWSGACSGTGSCDVTMDAIKTVTATFSVKPLVRIPGPTYYATIQEAYNASNNGDIIDARDQTFTEDLVFARPISVGLYGGNDEAYLTSIGYTTVNGSLSIVNGLVNVKNIIIQ